MQAVCYEAVRAVVTGWLMSYRTGVAVEDVDFRLSEYRAIYHVRVICLLELLEASHVPDYASRPSRDIIHRDVPRPHDFSCTSTTSAPGRHRWSGSRTCPRISSAIASQSRDHDRWSCGARQATSHAKRR